MATTKVIKDLTELNPGNPDYVLNATNAVTVINPGSGNKYYFDGVYDGKFGLRIGTTVLTGVPSDHPFAVLNNGLTGITYTGTVNEGTLAVGGFTYTFYSGDITITVTADFGVASYYCKIHGYMGGENNFVSVYSEAGLKMPSSNAAYSGPTVAEGMMRNEVGQVSESSASTMQHYNGTDWKNFVNKAAISTFSVDFLVVGGGASGGADGPGGGGAGGLRTSYTGSPNAGSGGGGNAETALSLSTNVSYTVTIGEGGVGTSTGNAQGNNGADSVVSGLGMTTITSIGGGGGGAYLGSPGKVGGSGGGGGNTSGGGAGLGGDGTNTTNGDATDQGFNGGNGTGGAGYYPGGGGGGAGVAGANAANSTTAGNGGAGLEVNIIGGTGNFYGGGGGGGGYNNLGTPGSGGSGGGGVGSSSATPGNGTDGLGGGGGGNQTPYTSGAGGSGVVILRYSNAKTAIYTAGSGGAADSEVTIGSDKYIKITAGTGTIKFS